MRKGNLIKMAAPAIISAAMMVSAMPVGVMAAEDFAQETSVETEDAFASEETADFGSESEEVPFADEEHSQEFTSEAQASEDEVKYVYAGLTWEEYWRSEGVYNATNTESNSTADAHGETDKGGFDAVTRATPNHGLHRGSYQCTAILYDVDGGSYQISHWNSNTEAVLTDGSVIFFNTPERLQITKTDGTVTTMKDYIVTGMKYIPVAVKASDYEAFKQKYQVVENGGTVAGGYGEGTLSSYSELAQVTAETNGLKEAVKDADGNFTFTARKTGNGSGLQDKAQKTASDIEVNVRSNTGSTTVGSYGEFLRVDLTGSGYSDLGANMYAVRWDYYGNGDTVLRSFGTKFAADNWMHKSMGIQLGLTDSYRCQLPEGTDGTGKWVVTVYAMGYTDSSFAINVTSDDIYKPTAEAADKTALKAAVEKAQALNEAEYRADSWSAMQAELEEAKDALEKEDATQPEVDEAASHLNAAIEALVKVNPSIKFAKSSVTLYKGQTKVTTASLTDLEGTVTYKTNNKKVAVVNKTTGKVSAKAAGTATITATCGEYTATYKVTVKNPTLKVSKTAVSVKAGKKATITATATPSGTVKFTSSNTKVATVSSKGVITGKTKGTATIKVTCNGVTKTVKVTVK